MKKINFFEIGGYLLLIAGLVFAVLGLKDFLSFEFLVDNMKENNGVMQIAPSFFKVVSLLATAATIVVFIILSLIGKGLYKRPLIIPFIISAINIVEFGMFAIGELSNSVVTDINYVFVVTNALIIILVGVAWYFEKPKDLVKLIIFSSITLAVIVKDIIQLISSFEIYYIFEMVAFLVFTLGHIPFPFNKKEEMEEEKKEDEKEEEEPLPQNN